MSPSIEVHRLDAARRGDFLRLHSEENGAGWCRCVAWWVAGWEGWGERTSEENLRLREGLFARGAKDGYLLYVDGAPAAWCQASPRDELPGIRADFELEPDPGAWAVSCFFVAPGHRRRGLARRLLEAVLDQLRGLGATRVEAYPRITDSEEAGELWNGPEAMFRALGFETALEGERRRVLARAL